MLSLSSEEDRATATLTCTENFVKFGRVVFETRPRTDGHAYTLITILVGGLVNKWSK